ncbi:putative quinol monooxygenase [Streptomyces sp. NPDC001978]|uniref:putative quinol monooxygenase n=1 Tax=Streptomyces sp. NPDC001978 TaxID=3364627 RepID=UPI0036A78D4E
MRALIVEVDAQPGKRAEFLEAILDDAVCSETDEPGCLRFDVLQDADDAGRFYLHEIYADQTAIDAHAVSAHFRRLAAALPELIVGDLRRRTGDVVHPEPEQWR